MDMDGRIPSSDHDRMDHDDEYEDDGSQGQVCS